MPASAAMTYFGFCAPTFLGLMYGPSMLMPTRSAPRSFLWAAATSMMPFRISSLNVMVAGQMASTPLLASKSAMACRPASSASQKS